MRGHGIPLETLVVFYLSGVGKKVSTLTLMNNSISLCVSLVTVMKRVLLSLFSTSKVYGDLNHGEIKGTIQLFFFNFTGESFESPETLYRGLKVSCEMALYIGCIQASVFR